MAKRLLKNLNVPKAPKKVMLPSKKPSAPKNAAIPLKNSLGLRGKGTIKK
jgi:hypothetical protein